VDAQTNKPTGKADAAGQTLEQLAEEAQRGSLRALDQLLSTVQDKIYTLAARMLWCPDDARDATQEILIKLATHLGSFRHESTFMTWSYSVAVNYLRSVRKGRLEDRYTFETFGQELSENLSEYDEAEDPVQTNLLLEEIRIGCTMGMLLCLDRAHRVAYILGEILELDGEQAAQILEVPSATYRKRLSRARAEMVKFMQDRCGLVRSSNSCKCNLRLNHALQIGRVNPAELVFAEDPEAARRYPQVLEHIHRLEESQRVVALYRARSELAAPGDLLTHVRAIINDPSLHP
jgi:RNA polymerase sigma factor (sigma-70 family)